MDKTIKIILTAIFFYAGWSTSPGSLENPSEWGNLVFIGKKKHSLLFAVLASCVVFSCFDTVFKQEKK